MWGALVCKYAKNQKPVESRGEGGVGAWLSFGVYGNGLECGSVRSGSSGTVEI